MIESREVFSTTSLMITGNETFHLQIEWDLVSGSILANVKIVTLKKELPMGW
jgi:hypothetical protein